MAKYRRKPEVVDVKMYKKGMEDGFTLEDYIYPTEGLIWFRLGDTGTAITSGLDRRVYPWIKTPGGNKYIPYGAYVITKKSGERDVCNREWFESNYELIE